MTPADAEAERAEHEAILAESPPRTPGDWEELFALECRAVRDEGLGKDAAGERLAAVAGAAVDYGVNWRAAIAKGKAFLRSQYESPLTDLWNARRFVAEHGGDVRFVHDRKRWLVWDGKRFSADTAGAVERLAQSTADGIIREALQERDERRHKLLVHGTHTSSAPRLRAMLELAANQAEVSILARDLDRDPWLLNCENGTLDLRSGGLRPHRREDLITRAVPVAFDEKAVCPIFDDFISRIMGGNEQLERFLRRAVGYSLTGDVSEQVLFILWGSGFNGKSTFVEIVTDLLADYALSCPVETLLVKRGGGIPNDVARLAGARFVSAIEAQEGRPRQLAEQRAPPHFRDRPPQR